jgi:hypothetical protein
MSVKEFSLRYRPNIKIFRGSPDIGFQDIQNFEENRVSL